MRDGLIKVAAGTPQVRVADCRYNAESCFTLMREAYRQGVRVLVLPELCLTGATCGDLLYQEALLRGAEEALATVLEATKSLDMVTALGLPVQFGHRVYSCAAVVHKGELLGVVPKGGDAARRFRLCSRETFFGAGLLFSCATVPGLTLGVELGEELMAPVHPSALLAQGGATVILHPAAGAELVGRNHRRRGLVVTQSLRLACGYIHAGAGEGESTTDQVFAAPGLIAENGVLLEESRSFGSGLTISELDVQRLLSQRRRRSDFRPENGDLVTVNFDLEPSTTLLTRPVSPTPFVPEDAEARRVRCDEVLIIAAMGLKKRLEHTGAKCAVVGLSGGLDSTLAILITATAMRLLDRPASDIIAVTMPCFGTTDRTRDNAVELAERLGATLKRVDISNSVRSHFTDIGQSMENHDVTFENAQARERTQVIMDIANQLGGLVVGTGDLSELALGWATYNGDHMSMYGVNAAIPKTLVRHLVSYVSKDKEDEDEALSNVLADILDTPVSPELLPAVGGQITQKTEDLVGPYELHDFFLYYAVRWGFPPRKILRLAEYAFGRAYDRSTILKWERVFFRRFFSQQFKRSCLPDGSAVGSVSLSPRGSWAMPSDAVASLWLEELEGLD
ncbi:MAG: NAD(+) synthase [Clostridia bacterium]|nr:NAD(+) synthase [Clostridia bacterium]